MATNQPKLAHRLGIALSLREPPSVPPYGWSYFDHMVAVYLTLNQHDPRAAAVIEKSSTRPYGLTWGDIFLLENVILSLQPVDVLCRNSWIVRERFREIAGPAIYDRYVDSGIPKEADTPEKVSLLRADLSRILDFLHWYYALIPIRERKRKMLTASCIWLVILYTVGFGWAVILLYRDGKAFLAVGACVLFWGIIGGFVSSQRRMQSIPTDGDPLISVFGLENAGYYLWLSPLLGAIFAAVLSLLFISGILEGTVFPAFNQNATGYLAQAIPASSMDYAKLFTWCFLAGFAERLVPDSLDRLTEKMGSSTKPPTSAAPANGAKVPPIVSHEAKDKVPMTTVHDALHSGETEEPEGGTP
ncbi:MAG TPA: hypothetical protein VLI45_05350 [Acidobacteriaceae bacterium]|nr:hypothetical protein [Acidobacteriaceae bacterium]